MKILIAYFSWTDCVAELAGYLCSRLETEAEVLTVRIVPEKKHGYWGWLSLSFLPGFRTPIQPAVSDLEKYDLVCLGFPKWTLSCPPVNQYISEMRFQPGKAFGLFMSFGGFGGERFLENIARRVGSNGGRIVATASVRRRTLGDGSFRSAIDRFCRTVLQAKRADITQPRP